MFCLCSWCWGAICCQFGGGERTFGVLETRGNSKSSSLSRLHRWKVYVKHTVGNTNGNTVLGVKAERNNLECTDENRIKSYVPLSVVKEANTKYRNVKDVDTLRASSSVRIEHQPSKLRVTGSNPVRHTFNFV